MLYRPYVKAEPSNLFFSSGQLPIVEGSDAFPASFAEQAKAVLQNLLKLAEAEGGSRKSFVKITVFLTDMNHFSEFNSIYQDFFQGCPMPARTCVEVSRLPREALIEAEAIFCSH